jgi:hypothetical protein
MPRTRRPPECRNLTAHIGNVQKYSAVDGSKPYRGNPRLISISPDTILGCSKQEIFQTRIAVSPWPKVGEVRAATVREKSRRFPFELATLTRPRGLGQRKRAEDDRCVHEALARRGEAVGLRTREPNPWSRWGEVLRKKVALDKRSTAALIRVPR